MNKIEREKIDYKAFDFQNIQLAIQCPCGKVKEIIHYESLYSKPLICPNCNKSLNYGELLEII